MAKRTTSIAKKLGAKLVATFPETGGGAFGAARLATLRQRLQPQNGLRPGRPTEASWNLRRKVPMSNETFAKLKQLADRLSDDKRKVSPMQLAAQLLETSLQAAEATYGPS